MEQPKSEIMAFYEKNFKLKKSQKNKLAEDIDKFQDVNSEAKMKYMLIDKHLNVLTISTIKWDHVGDNPEVEDYSDEELTALLDKEIKNNTTPYKILKKGGKTMWTYNVELEQCNVYVYQTIHCGYLLTFRIQDDVYGIHDFALDELMDTIEFTE